MSRDLLGGLTEEQRRSVASRMTRRAFRKGDAVFFEGEPGDSLYVLQKGTVAVQASTPRGDVVTLSVLGPGAAFGEQALIGGDQRRTATVVALEACETRVLNRADFDDLRTRYPVVDRFLVDLLAAHVRRVSKDLVEALYTPVETRLANRLVELADLFGSQQSPMRAEAVTIPVRQEDLATMAGTTRPTANKVLRLLAEQGIVSLARGSIVVLDRTRLRAAAPVPERVGLRGGSGG